MTPYFFLLPFALLLLTFAASGQRVAVLTPDKSQASKAFAEQLETQLSKTLNVLDDSLSEAAYSSVAPASPFNLTTDMSKEIGAVIGCDSFILLRSMVQRRSAYKRNEYYEAYAVVYAVSARTGRLVFWRLQRFEDAKPDKAEKPGICARRSKVN